MQNKNGIEHFDLDKHKRPPEQGTFGTELKGHSRNKDSGAGLPASRGTPIVGPRGG